MRAVTAASIAESDSRLPNVGIIVATVDSSSVPGSTLMFVITVFLTHQPLSSGEVETTFIHLHRSLVRSVAVLISVLYVPVSSLILSVYFFFFSVSATGPSHKDTAVSFALCCATHNAEMEV